MICISWLQHKSLCIKHLPNALMFKSFLYCSAQELLSISDRCWGYRNLNLSNSTGWCISSEDLKAWVLFYLTRSSAPSALALTRVPPCVSDRERICLEAGVSGSGHPRAQLRSRLQRQMCLQKVRTPFIRPWWQWQQTVSCSVWEEQALNAPVLSLSTEPLQNVAHVFYRGLLLLFTTTIKTVLLIELKLK